jgi:hypothetical protein
VSILGGASGGTWSELVSNSISLEASWPKLPAGRESRDLSPKLLAELGVGVSISLEGFEDLESFYEGTPW